MTSISSFIQLALSRSLVRYGCVGVFVASAHALMALALKFGLGVSPTLSNFAGFLTGAVLSYFGSYYFTFKSDKGHSNTLPRFALVWLIGIIVNVGIFKWLLITFAVPFAFNVVIAIVLTPIGQYLMLKFWAFKKA